MNFYDMTGKEIKVGSLVAYPALSGRSCQLETGHVLELFARSQREQRDFEDRHAHSVAMRSERDAGWPGRDRPADPPDQDLLDIWHARDAIEDQIHACLLTAPAKVRVMPTGFGSRFPGNTYPARAALLTANASSLIVIG